MKKEKQKIGKNKDDIFGKPRREIILPIHDEEPEPLKEAEPSKEIVKEKAGRGRPVEHSAAWTKVTVVLLDRQIHWLDSLSLAIRQKTKAAISRAEIIRALIDAVEESGLDLTDIPSEQEIKRFILARIQQKQKPD